MTYKRKIIEVEAMQFDGKLKPVEEFLDNKKAIKRDDWLYDKPVVFLQTAYGVKVISKGDYIVKDGDRVLLYTEELFNKLFDIEVEENEGANQDEAQSEQN